MQNKKRTFANIILWLIFPLILGSCLTEDSPIPDREVYLRRNIISTNLLSPGSYLYITVPELSSDRLGYGGLIVVYTYDETEPYCAFDVTCPNEATPTIRISEPDDLLICTCETCGERYNLMFGLGTPMDGISKYGLKKYTAYIDPNNDQYIIVTQ